MAWNDLAPQVIQRLSTDLQLTPQQAAGIVGQLGYESDGLQAINERNPVVPGSRGGFGWAQWTGPRRQAFEQFAQQKGLNVADPEANYQFLLSELTEGPESRVVPMIRTAQDAQTAGRIFTDQFLRPGVPAYDKRQSWTEKALNFIIPSAQAAEAPQPQASIADRIKRAREAGFNDEEILARIQGNADMAARIQKAKDAGFTDEEIYSRMGITLPKGQSPQAPGVTLDESGQVPQVANPKLPPALQNQGPAGNANAGGLFGGFAQGLRDPIDAGAQMLRRAVPESVGQAVDRFGNYLSDLGLPVARSDGVQGVDALVNQSNQQYQADRAAAGRSGFDAARMGGNIAATWPLVSVFGPGAISSLPARIGAGAAQGAGIGLLQPVIGEDAQKNFWANKADQATGGALVGAAAPVVAGALGRLVSPKASQADSMAKLLRNEGVQLTPGQISGGWVGNLEDKAMSLPILGDAIRGARGRAQEQLNRAVYNRVLEPIGASTNKVGRAAVEEATRKVSQAYDDVLKQVTFRPDNGFSQTMQRLSSMADELPAREAQAFRNILNREVIGPLSKGQAIDGVAFKQIESNLGEQASRFLSSADAYQKSLGQAISELQSAMRESLMRMNPQAASRLRDVNASFANLVRLQRAAGTVGAADGVFTPAQLAQAVRSSDRTVRKNAYAQGRALMQDLSDAAREVMPTQIPNSGTADRLFLGGGTAFFSPQTAMGLGAASLPYLGPANRLIGATMTNRPASAQRLADVLRKFPSGAAAYLLTQ